MPKWQSWKPLHNPIYKLSPITDNLHKLWNITDFFLVLTVISSAPNRDCMEPVASAIPLGDETRFPGPGVRLGGIVQYQEPERHQAHESARQERKRSKEDAADAGLAQSSLVLTPAVRQIFLE